MTGGTSLLFDFHGCAVEFSCADRQVREAVAGYFSHFSADARPRIRIEARLEEPPRPLPKAVFRARQWSVLRSPKGKRLVWYPEGALCEYDYSVRRGTATSSDAGLLKELSYLLILSRAGEELDKKGFHRLHAGALGFSGEALLFCGGRGTGKTTLLLELLKDRSFSLLSDDTPVISRDGTVLPFPLRIGLGLDSPHIGSFDGLVPFRRRRYAPKRLLDIGKSGFVISDRLPPGAVFLLRRGRAPSISPVGPAAAFRELAVSLAAGYGVPQLAEFFLRPAASDIARKTAILRSRLKAAAALYRRASFYTFSLGPSPADNAETFTSFLNSGSARAARR